MATRFRRIRTRKMRKANALKTRKHRGGSWFSKKSPLSSTPSNLTIPISSTNAPLPNILPKIGEKFKIKDWIIQKALYQATVENVGNVGKGITLKNETGKTIKYSWKDWNTIEKEKNERLQEIIAITAQSLRKELERANRNEYIKRRLNGKSEFTKKEITRVLNKMFNTYQKASDEEIWDMMMDFQIVSAKQ